MQSYDKMTNKVTRSRFHVKDELNRCGFRASTSWIFEPHKQSVTKGSCKGLLDFYKSKVNHEVLTAAIFKTGGVLDIFLGGEVRPDPSYPDPV